MIFSKIQVQFRIRIRIRIRIHKLKLQIRILQKVSDPYGSGSTTLVHCPLFETFEEKVDTGIFSIEKKNIL
jgi:hypothetical protein